MDRQAFIAPVGGGMLMMPLAAEAQQATKVYRIGFLGLSSATDYTVNLDAFRHRSIGSPAS